MDAYTGFAGVYDLFMDNVPYRQWCDFIHEQLQKEGMKEQILLDLGCGTGTMTRMMAEMGYDMIGVDNSPEMLDIARELEYARLDGEEQEASEEEEEFPDTEEEELQKEEVMLPETEEYYTEAYQGDITPTLYLCQDMRELELYGTIGACYCACDSLNYILEEAELKEVFRRVNNYLFPGGLFIFDINTPYKYETLLGERTIAENRPEGSFIWENSYDPESRINIYDLTLYIREDTEEEAPQDMPYYRYQETHYQKCYSPEEIRRLLEEAGMEFVAAYDCYSDQPVRPDSEKITFIAREKGKEKKND